MRPTYRHSSRDDLFAIFDNHAKVRMSLGDDDGSSADAATNVDQDRALRKVLPGESCQEDGSVGSCPRGCHWFGVRPPTLQDEVLRLPLPRTRHSMAKPDEARLVPGQLQPWEVPKLSVEGEIEGSNPLLVGLDLALVGRGLERVVDVDSVSRGEVGKTPVRKAGTELDRFVASVVICKHKIVATRNALRGKTYVRATNAATPSVSVYFLSGLWNHDQ